MTRLGAVLCGLVIFPCFIASLAMTSLGVNKFTFERALMGTRFVITCYAKDHAHAASAAERAFSKAEHLNAIASDYLPDSELSLLTTKDIGRPIPLSPLLFDLLHHSRALAEATNGAFDPTLGPLTQLWRESRNQKCLPTPEKLQAARDASGWQYFTLHAETHSIILLRKHMAFDLGGVAKGYAADMMLESLREDGISQALIAAGGDIRLGDPPPGRNGWRVALRTFNPMATDEVRELANVAVSTSGDLYQFIEIDGVHYAHLINPKTGLGLTQPIAASVIADEAKLSDPIATAACVRGINEANFIHAIPHIHALIMRLPNQSHAIEINPATTTRLSAKGTSYEK